MSEVIDLRTVSQPVPVDTATGNLPDLVIFTKKHLKRYNFIQDTINFILSRMYKRYNASYKAIIRQ